MKEIRTREKIMKEIDELEEKITDLEFELDESEDDEIARDSWRKFAKQLKIAQEETGLPEEECLDLIKEFIKNGK